MPQMSNNAAIKVRNVSFDAAGEAVLDEVSLDVVDGQCIALLGPSGAGKTSLLRIVAGLQRPKGGDVRIFGRSSIGSQVHEQPAVNMLFQDPVLFPGLSVRDNALMAARGLSRAIAEKKVDDLANRFELGKLLTRKVSESLSGGERQRAALLRAFASEAPILLLDEPLKASLNADLRWTLLRRMRDVIHLQRRTTLFVTHDYAEATYVADVIAVLADTKLYVGEAEAMYRNPPTLSVAGLLGPGNVLDAEQLLDEARRSSYLPINISSQIRASRSDKLFVRASAVQVIPQRSGLYRVMDIRFVGTNRIVWLRANRPGTESVELEADVPSDMNIQVGMSVEVAVADKDILVFDKLGARKAVP